MAKERVTVTIEADVLNELRDLGGHNVSGLVEQAIIEYLESQTQAEIIRCSICGNSSNQIIKQNQHGTLCRPCYHLNDQSHPILAQILGLEHKKEEKE